MLVLTRRAGESIQIGDDIVIRIAEITADKMKLQINAPKEIPIMRSELLEAQSVNRDSVQSVRPQTISEIAQLLHHS